MLGMDRRAAKYAWTIALVVVLLYVVFLIRKTLFVFILALLFAYLLSPLVNLLDRVLPSRTRTAALALAYVIFVGLVVLIGSQIGSRVVEEANALLKKLPTMLQEWQQTTSGGSLQDQILNRIRIEIATHSSDLLGAIPAASLKALTVASNAIYVVIIPILAFFFLKDANAIRRHILELVEDGPRRDLLEDVMADASLLLAHYMRALVLLSLGTFTAYSLFFLIAGVPYSFLLAALAGMLEFIPMLGPLTAGVAILVVAAVSGAHVFAVLIFLLAYRLFQDYIFSPHLMGHGIQLHPLLVLFGVFAGAEIAGIAGTFLSVPVLALGRVIYVRIRKTRLNTRPTPQTPFLR